ncbi:abc transporter [Holotrichia oblita]|nr:abc transporter [Holotrichia oblita]
MPLIDNVNMNEEIDEQRIKECKNALKKSGIYEKAISLDNGIDTPLTKEFDDKGVVLSGGEAQRLAIARVYAQNSPIIILDEPSSALDPIAEYEMYESLSDTYRNKNDKMVVLISHRLSFAILADKIYFLENGSVLEEGTHSELMSLNHAYADMFNKQAQSYQK